MKHFVSVILVNYKWGAFNEACITSLLQQTYDNFEIIFVDNASKDWSAEHVATVFHHIISSGKLKIIYNNQNFGFAQWNNIGVSYADAKSEYIALLNNDTVVPDNRLEELVNGIESDRLMWCVGSFVLDKGSEQALHDLYYKKHLWWINNYIFETSFRHLTQREVDNDIFYTTWIGWCALLYKKCLLDKPFPDFYFAYTEDTYFSICLLTQWYKLAVCWKSIVHHFGSGSFGKWTNVFKSFHGTKNALCNNIIIHSTKNLLLLMPTILLYHAVKIASSYQLIRLQWFLKAVYWCFKHRKIIMAEKERFNSYKKLSDKAILKQLSTTIFENIYFFPIPKWQIYIMQLFNKISHVYFSLISLWQGK